MSCRKILSVMLVMVLAFGVQSVSFAAEINSDRTAVESGETNGLAADGMINLLDQQTYYTMDANGNIEVHTKKGRLTNEDMTIPANGSIGWFVTVYEGANRIDVGVTPSVRIGLSIKSNIGLPIYNYEASVVTGGLTHTYNNQYGYPWEGIFFIHNLSSSPTRVTQALFQGQ
ncbi:MAG: hypothetical protein K2P40_05050 [Lachnospiraceae bacterium]|nr:hypothetical protein [Lachnospiraceae bacterium]MDE6940294.1 hypothetical protein [Lachnospiraceae bacterium]MDE6990530.1 hypothetical protein [Lachnospiraceae bacterium]MDE7000200.1 hypothetical protein [Lachnospiraceae bacterium]